MWVALVHFPSTSVSPTMNELPPIELEISDSGNSAVIAIRGRLAGDVQDTVRQRLESIARQHRVITFDLRGMTGFSAVGVRRLLNLCRYLRSRGAVLAAEGVAPEVRALVDAAGFTDLLRSSTINLPTPKQPKRRQVDVYPTHSYEGYALRIGSPIPLGASQSFGGTNFSLFSKHATSVSLVLFPPGESTPLVEIPFPPEFRVGDIYTMLVFDLDPESFSYGFRVDGEFEPARGLWFDRSKILLDPYARCIVTQPASASAASNGAPAVQYLGTLFPEDFDWEGDQPLNLPFEDLIIYEAHVRGFTKSETAKVTFPGTFAGLRDRIPWLVELGVNCLELLPVFQFLESDCIRTNPLTGELLKNYWGYNTIGFFAPHAGFAATSVMGTQADEFKALVKELHRNGIEVMLDVVFNHTAEGNQFGPTISFRGIDNKTYYMLTPTGEYLNFSGCGNTVNCNHPVVREFVLTCLRYWVSEYHVDGFRFDLASILGRAADGTPLANPPLLESLAMDPVLSKTKLIAEAWDAGGMYQVGTFPAYGRWAEWNGKYRDSVRKTLKGDMGQMAEFRLRLIGSPDIYPTRGPTASVNFITCHDGFTLADLVSYNQKHNEANGENNNDGSNDNLAWNCGVEGNTSDPKIVALRMQQMKNALTILFLSHGVPLLLMGDEIGRTQGGNNNAYCQDNPISWMDWTLADSNAELLNYCQRMIAFRGEHRILRQRVPVGPSSGTNSGLTVTWHGTRVAEPDVAYHSRVLAMTLQSNDPSDPDTIYAAFNFYWESLVFELPEPPIGQQWHQFANTGNTAPDDICSPVTEMKLVDSSTVTLGPRAIVILVAE